MYFLDRSDLCGILIELENIAPDLDMNLVVKLRAEINKIDVVEFEEYGEDLKPVTHDESILSGDLGEKYLQWLAFCDDNGLRTNCFLNECRLHFSSFLGLDELIDFLLMQELENEYRETFSY